MASTQTTQDNPTPGLTWLEADSKQGESYKVARTEYELAAEAKANESAEGENSLSLWPFGSDKQNFDTSVHWEVTGNKMVQTSQDVADRTSITSYRLVEAKELGFAPWPQYYLEFNCNKTYNFWFQDESGDRYQNNTFLTGSHGILFNSTKPTITRIIGN